MAGGCPKKKQKNISGLCGQQKKLPELQNRSEMDPILLAVNLELENQDDDNIQGELDTYGLKTNFEEEYCGNYATDESGVDEEVELGHLNDEEFSRKLAEMVAREAHPITYKIGPDVMSKSERTHSRYRVQWKSQTNLDAFGFKKALSNASTCHPVTSSASNMPKLHLVDQSHNSRHNSEQAIPQVRLASEQFSSSDLELDGDQSDSAMLCKRSSCLSSDLDEPDPQIGDISGSGIGVQLEGDVEEVAENEGDAEDWEDELEVMTSGGGEIHDWKALRDQIQGDLKKHLKTLPLSQLNQLHILSSFATLQLKGVSRINASLEIARQWHDGKGTYFARSVRALARHYQVFEQLPHEKRGQNGHSFLHDESVQNHCHAWLSNLPAGKVTPQALQRAVNTTIFPQLGINPKWPISEQTARRWLIKLGWRKTVIQKGVYMDGHEHDDVVEHWKNVFLPQMEGYEQWMIHFEGPELIRTEPNLETGK
ncbi:hypothetical protein BKA82DRAFT_4357635 [Pisolithus tinctorius]|nr:hypothetical protein BKA82DRAFT_4357635 [Pisolithus tinctorius]